ncbi:MAG: hypothetical protein ACREN8_09905 [Candidatus Dormibacteraceae bacterium]
MPTLYRIIADLRAENHSGEALKTLDLITAELGRNQENLWAALANLRATTLPLGGEQILEKLAVKAEAAGVDNLNVPLSPKKNESGWSR